MWFYVSIGLLLFTLLYTFYRYRIHQINKIHQIRENIASDLHDDIGSRLTNISVLSIISEDDKMPVIDRKRYLKKISEEALASGEALDEIVRNMHMHNEELDDISARMRRYTGEIFDNGQPAFTMQIDNYLTHRHMDLEKKRDLFLVYKEILNNIQKHAKAENIYIKIYGDTKYLILSVKDDGNGFNPGEQTNRNGIKNIKSRIGKWGGNVKIISGENAGTEVQIQLPF
jgi:signal transduction histidine kinase